MDPGRLILSREEMREMGYRVVDLLVEHHAGLLETDTIVEGGTREELESLLREPLPLHGRPPLDVLERTARDILHRVNHVDHPRFLAFIPGPSIFVGAMGAALAAGINVFAGNWYEGAAAAQVELLVLDWLRERFDLPSGAGGLFVSGGSAANVTALAVARRVMLLDRVEGAVVYVGDQTHSSVERGLRLLGFPLEAIRRLPTDAEFRMDPARVAAAVEADRRAGLRPFCVVATAGTTNTGAVDPLPALRALCTAEDLWLHVDGAYGAGAVLCAEGRARLQGLGHVDSFSLDPHKWLFQPFESGVVWVRSDRELVETFRILPEYLKDVDARAGEVNYCDRGIQLTRSFRALPLWMSLQVFGARGFEEGVARGFEMARRLADGLESRGWQIVTQPSMGIVTFRYAPDGWSDEAVDRLTRTLVEAIHARRFTVIFSTELRGRPVLRACPINPRLTPADMEAVADHLHALALERTGAG